MKKLMLHSSRFKINKFSHKFFSSKKISFNFEDPLDLNSLLKEEETMIMNSARDFCQSQLFPGIIKANREEVFDRNIMKEFGKMGFLGATLKDYGCPGVSSVSYGLINREVERVDSAYRSAMSVQSSLVYYK